jgi:multidrug resistance efflux pump
MVSNRMRIGILVSCTALVAFSIAAAQDRKAGEAGGQGHGGVAVFNSVEGRTTVLSIRPEGSRVEKGEIVCELDPTELRDRLAGAELAVQAALADVQGARLAREVALLALTEYEQGRFVHDKIAAEGEIKLAESNLARQEDVVEWTRRMFDKGYVSMAEKVSEEHALRMAVFDMERAHSKLKLLLVHTKGKTIKALTGQVETARARELAKQAALERAQAARKRLDGQIHRCKVASPTRGQVEYAGPIGIGAVVHDGQVLVRIVPDGTAAPASK